MVHIYKFFLALLLLSSISCSGKIQKLSIEKADNFPLWLKDSQNHTEQTSGIVYIGKTKNGFKSFLLADDIGDLHYMELENSYLSLSKVKFSGEVKSFLKKFPKKDFEDLTYDRGSGTVYVSIEGNGKSFKDFVGIYKLTFENKDLRSGSVTAIEKVEITPGSEFLNYTAQNIGYEGLAVDDNNLYLGLEAGNEMPILSENTYILIVDKKTLSIKKRIDTRSLEITSICGLYSYGNKKLIGIDRNSKKIFYIDFDDSLNIKYSAEAPVHTSIPLYPDLDYVASLESITMDDENNVYIIDDPWKSQFIPSDNILSKLDQSTVANFKRYIPVIFKYKLYVKN